MQRCLFHRNGHIPKVQKHVGRIAHVADGVVTMEVIVSEVRVGDEVYLKRQGQTVLDGPFVITSRTYVHQQQHNTIRLTWSSTDWPAYNHQHDLVLIVNQGRTEWYLEDLRRLKLVFPAAIAILHNTVEFAAGNQAIGNGNASLGELVDHIDTIVDGDEIFATTLSVRPDEGVPGHVHVRQESAPEVFPTMMTTGTHHTLVLKPLEIVSQQPFMFHLGDTRYGARDFVYGFARMDEPELAAFVAHHPNEELKMSSTLPGPFLGTEWEQIETVQICGREGTGTVLFNFHTMFPLGEIPSTIRSTNRTILPEPSGKVTRILQKGNKENTVKYTGSLSGRPLNMQEHDYIRSERQGQVDLCQHFHSVLISSRDIGVRPEKSNTPRSLAPIISSYLLPPTISGFNCDAHGNIQGYSEVPYGTVRFSESSQRRFHKLVQIPGDLRQFSITAELAPRDNRIPPEQVMLAPGEAFSWQLMFVKEY